MRWTDITLTLTPQTPAWPGHKPLTQTFALRIEDGEDANLSHISLSSHLGTHLDAPLHFVARGASVEQLPLDCLVGPCRVIDFTAGEHLTAHYLASIDLGDSGRLLFRTANSQRFGSNQFYEDYIAFLPDAVQFLVEHGVRVLGTDGFSIGPFGDLNVITHQIYLGSGGIVLENLDLRQIEPGDYQLIALPLKVAGAEGAPARVLLGR